MQEQVTVTNTLTLSPDIITESKSKEEQEVKISKYKSQPKFKTYKQEILKIPKVKQILNKDKFVYSQDIEKRLELIGTVKSDPYTEE